MELCCYKFVSVNSETLVTFTLINFMLLIFHSNNNLSKFGTRLGLNYFKNKFIFNNTIFCGIDLALAIPISTND